MFVYLHVYTIAKPFDYSELNVIFVRFCCFTNSLRTRALNNRLSNVNLGKTEHDVCHQDDVDGRRFKFVVHQQPRCSKGLLVCQQYRFTAKKLSSRLVLLSPREGGIMFSAVPSVRPSVMIHPTHFVDTTSTLPAVRIETGLDSHESQDIKPWPRQGHVSIGLKMRLWRGVKVDEKNFRGLRMADMLAAQQ